MFFLYLAQEVIVKFFSPIKKITTLPVILIGLSLITTEAFAANIKRSCSAEYSASVDRITYESKNLGMPHDIVKIGFLGDAFTAQGGCGKLVPNRCRKRARDKLLNCARAHANSPNQLPQACSPNTVKKYPGANLQSIVKAAACKSKLGTSNHLKIKDFLPSRYQLKVLLKVHVRGGDDCGMKKPGKARVDGRIHNRSGNKLFVTEPLKYLTFSCP